MNEKGLKIGHYQPDSPERANNNADNNNVHIGFHFDDFVNKKSLSQMNEKGLKLDTTSLTHSKERIIILIIMMFILVFIVYVSKKAS